MAGDLELFNKALNDGHSAAWEQDWEEAIRLYRQALTEFPQDYSALTSLGLALLENQSYEEALRCYQKATEINPNDAATLSNIARIQERLGKTQDAFENNLRAAELFLKDKMIDQALENFQHAVALQPGNLNTRIRLATIYDRVGKKKESADEYLAIASLMQKSGDIIKARQAVNYAMQLVPGHTQAQEALDLLAIGENLPDPLRVKGGTGPMSMAKVFSMDEDTSEVQRDPIAEAQNKALVKLAGNLFAQDEDEQGAEQSVRKGIAAIVHGTAALSADRSAKSRIQLHLSRAIDFQTQADEQHAVSELERAVEIGLHKPEAYFDLGFLQANSNPDKAFTYLQQSVRNPEFALASYLLLARIHRDKGNLHESADEYLHALALADAEIVGPDQSEDLLQLYEPIFESQSQQTDEKQLKRIASEIEKELLRKDWRAFIEAARQQLPPPLAGAAPLPLVTLLIETRGGKVVESMAEIRRLADEGYYRSAMEEAFYAIPDAPYYLPLHAQMGEVLAREGRVQDAIEKFMLTSRLYNLRGETNQAVQLLTRVSQIVPMDLTVRSKLIELYTIQGKIPEAIKQHVALGDIYYRLAELDTARQTYLAGLKLTQESKGSKQDMIQLLSKIADIDIQRFDWRNAIRMYEQLRNLQPEDPGARAKLIDLNLRFDQAGAAMTELDSFVSMLTSTGSQAQAVLFCRGLVEEHPEQNEIRLKLAELLINEGDQNGAIAELEQALNGFIKTGESQRAANCVEVLISINPAKSKEYRSLLT